MYKAQRQLRPIQLKISCVGIVEIQDFTQVKNIRNFTQF